MMQNGTQLSFPGLSFRKTFNSDVSKEERKNFKVFELVANSIGNFINYTGDLTLKQ